METGRSEGAGGRQCPRAEDFFRGLLQRKDSQLIPALLVSGLVPSSAGMFAPGAYTILMILMITVMTVIVTVLLLCACGEVRVCDVTAFAAAVVALLFSPLWG